MRTPILHHAQIIKFSRLLDMLYRPAEIAEEIGVHPDTVYRSWIPAGLPYSRDTHGSLWIHGPACVAWARETVTRRRLGRAGLPGDQAWCVKCNRPVALIAPSVHPVNRYLELLQAPCPVCGSTVNRGRKAGG